MLSFIYALPLSFVLLIMFVAAGLWAECCLRRKKSWVTYALLSMSLAAIIYITILCRAENGTDVILTPFNFIRTAKMQPEAIRSAMMNIFLFFPLGLTLSNALPQRWGRWCRIGVTALVGFLLGTGIEYTQYRFALGVAETDDVICNTLGVFIGSTSLLIAHGIEKYKEKAIKHDSNKN